ncbi:hypothetical protein HOI83_01650 [Candidatus Uhrbacteria bacterium]|jgi:hypothetical protein|nr:hypothetical protein [Candidatus Uhrbacteria bacterium]
MRSPIEIARDSASALLALAKKWTRRPWILIQIVLAARSVDYEQFRKMIWGDLFPFIAIEALEANLDRVKRATAVALELDRNGDLLRNNGDMHHGVATFLQRHGPRSGDAWLMGETDDPWEEPGESTIVEEAAVAEPVSPRADRRRGRRLVNRWPMPDTSESITLDSLGNTGSFSIP